MNYEETEERINAIGMVGFKDPRKAHVMEDELYRDALQSIAEGHPFPSRLARMVLRVKNFNFPRWSA